MGDKGPCKKGFYCLASASSDTPDEFEFNDDGLILSNTTVCSTEKSCAGPCPAGYYCPVDGTILPLPCDENYFIKPSSRRSGAASKNQCVECEAGWWCRPGVAEPQPCPVGFYCEKDEFEPKACPVQTYRSETGAKSAEDCKVCSLGYFCNNLSMADQEQFPCK